MPRRRKRNISGARLRPLQFEESPVNILHKMPSPVYASDHPAMADVVPLDGTMAVPWVSPQFIRGPTPGGKLRRVRRTTSQVENMPVTRARRKQSQSLNTTNNPEAMSNIDKYKPLKFVGEVTTYSTNSSSEEVSIEEDENIHVKPTGVQQENVPQNQANRETSLKENTITGNSNTWDGLDVKCPDIDTPRNESFQIFGKMPSEKTVEPISSSTETSPTSFGTHRPSKANSKERSHKRLFVSKDIGNSDIPGQFESSVNDGDPFDMIPTRQSLRIKHLKENFFPNSQLLSTPESQKLKQLNNILVYDTPEEDYGLPVKDRRMRDVKKRSS